MTALFAFIGLLAYLILLPIWRGLILKKLWAWFIVPYFGLSELNVAFAIGFMLVFQQLRGYAYEPNDYSDKQKIYIIIASFAYPLVGLVLGYIFKQFI